MSSVIGYIGSSGIISSIQTPALKHSPHTFTPHSTSVIYFYLAASTPRLGKSFAEGEYLYVIDQ